MRKLKIFNLLIVFSFGALTFSSCDKENQLLENLTGTWNATPTMPPDSTSTTIILEYTFNACNDDNICNGSYYFGVFGDDTIESNISFTWKLNDELLSITSTGGTETMQILEWDENFMLWQPLSLIEGETFDLERIN